MAKGPSLGCLPQIHKIAERSLFDSFHFSPESAMITSVHERRAHEERHHHPDPGGDCRARLWALRIARDELLNYRLAAQCRQWNAETPRMVDGRTRLDQVTSDRRTVFYHMAILKASDTQIMGLKPYLSARIAHSLRSDPQSFALLQRDVAFRYLYRNAGGKPLLVFEIDKDTPVDAALASMDGLDVRLSVLAGNLEKKAPLQVNTMTRFDSVRAQHHLVISHYPLTGISDQDALAHQQATRQLNADLIYADPDFSKLLTAGAVLRFQYQNAAGGSLFSYDLDARCVAPSTDPSHDRVDDLLQAISADLNRTAAMLIDRNTRLESTTVTHHEISYHYTLLGLDDDRARSITDRLTAGTSDEFRKDPAMSHLLDEGVTFAYHYDNASGTPLIDVARQHMSPAASWRVRRGASGSGAHPQALPWPREQAALRGAS